ncbi:MAG: hypothetical protein GTO45_20985 [Candidatus Aminicenantes bacterium]|nr:hypothetical protein [Candidatus Aminicenantes bacterium]NIM81253.1 hypothetical protein [Candidatus Aminicenantes bacterium]NIN20639.1 hypothetical protein [Candidatus Aminicenantes bacterium]NIN44418.1 hypothetical protein [Candidatus Aminicenantes bacterium]NIN87237.1 hypothetical protein [Candidatus Aminicenantes bacterium]
MSDAIKGVRAKIRWKPTSAMHHLQKRKSRGHLPPDATLEDYEKIILKVLSDKSAQVYRYWYNRVPYVTVIAVVQNKQWLVMFNYDGIMESCFVLERPQQYLAKPGFEWIGFLREVDNEL